VAEATQKMREFNVLSLPVYSEQEKRFVGIVDTVSIMFFLAFGKFRVKSSCLLRKRTRIVIISSAPLIVDGRLNWNA